MRLPAFRGASAQPRRTDADRHSVRQPDRRGLENLDVKVPATEPRTAARQLILLTRVTRLTRRGNRLGKLGFFVQSLVKQRKSISTPSESVTVAAGPRGLGI